MRDKKEWFIDSALFSFVILAAVADDDAIAVVCHTKFFLSHVNSSDIIKEIVVPVESLGIFAELIIPNMLLMQPSSSFVIL